MSFFFLDSTARAAWAAATTQQAQLEGLRDEWSGQMSVRCYSAADAHLATVTHATPIVDPTTTPRSLILGAWVAESHVQDGAAAYAILAVPAGADILRADVSLAGAISDPGGRVRLDIGTRLRVYATASFPATETPAYISSLSPYEVRACSGTYAPINGDTTMNDATPSEWLTSDPGASDMAGVINAWSGGAKGAGYYLDVNGGGHGDSANNGIYRFDFSGSTAPTGWTVRGQSAIADVPPQIDDAIEYDDGAAPSAHTYDGMVRVANGDIYRFNAGPWGSGGISGAVWKYPAGATASSAWVRVVDNFGAGISGGVGSPTWYDPVSNKIFILASGQYDGKFYRCSADTLSAAVSAASTTPIAGYGSAAWDTTRERGLCLSNYLNSIAIDFDLETATLNETPLAVSDYSAITGKQMSLVFDDVCDCYWAFGGGSAVSSWDTIYRIDADTYAMTSHSLTGDAITVGTQEGSYGRWTFHSEWRMIGTVAAHNAAAAVIRLPSS